MDEGIFGQRWILGFANGTILTHEDTAESTNIPDKQLWQYIKFNECVGHCVNIGEDINITVTNLVACAPSFAPTPAPVSTLSPNTLSPTRVPTLHPTLLPTSSPSESPTSTDRPTLMPTSSPSDLPTLLTPEPTEHPTFAPTESPTPYPTSFCDCLRITGDEISGLFTMIDKRNTRFQWEDGETGWTLYWLEHGLFAGNWILQGNDHDYY
jgi:hypothetical protein